jgi:hypothetical protein
MIKALRGRRNFFMMLLVRVPFCLSSGEEHGRIYLLRR